MSGGKTVAINENEINRLILEINDYAINARKIFDEIESIVEGTSAYYDCSCATKYRNSFNNFKSNFPIMVSNILTYKTDMQNLKTSFVKKESVLSNQIKDETKRVLSDERN